MARRKRRFYTTPPIPASTNRKIAVKFVTTLRQNATAVLTYEEPTEAFIQKYPNVDLAVLNPTITDIFVGAVDECNSKRTVKCTDKTIWEYDSDHIVKLALASIALRHFWSRVI